MSDLDGPRERGQRFPGIRGVVTTDHLDRFPTPRLLKVERLDPRVDAPRGPRVAQLVRRAVDPGVSLEPLRELLDPPNREGLTALAEEELTVPAVVAPRFSVD